MRPFEELEQKEREVESLRQNVKRQQESCLHEFGGEIYDPDKRVEGCDPKLVGQGSDHYYEYQSYRDVEVPRWVRQCRKCGLKQFAFKQKTKVVNDGLDWK